LIHDPNNNEDEIYTDELPAFNKNPKDVAGAGDSLLCCASLAMAVGANIFEAAYIGSIGAAIQVSRVGNTPLTPGELLEALVS
jgi:bifunctional ADP-heptose synthase (sugar kinase/adenylyltransferase)